jgi:hypothetical protein
MPYYEDNPTGWNANQRDWDAESWNPPEPAHGFKSKEEDPAWELSRSARTYCHIAFIVDSMLAEGRVPVMILLSGKCHYRMTQYVLNQRKNPEARDKKLLLGMAMVCRRSLAQPFQILDAYDAQKEGLM